MVSEDAANSLQLTADCNTSVERRQRIIGHPELIAWQAGNFRGFWLTTAQVTAAHDVNYPADIVGEVGWSCAAETAESHNTQAKPYPLWDVQTVEILRERRNAFRMPRWKDKSCGGVEDRVKCVQKVTSNADQHWVAVADLADNQSCDKCQQGLLWQTSPHAT